VGIINLDQCSSVFQFPIAGCIDQCYAPSSKLLQALFLLMQVCFHTTTLLSTWPHTVILMKMELLFFNKSTSSCKRSIRFTLVSA